MRQLSKIKDIEELKLTFRHNYDGLKWAIFDYNIGMRSNTEFIVEWYDEFEDGYRYIHFNRNGYPMSKTIVNDY